MKTKDLIALLQDADPTGEEEVCVGNCDIFYVESLPAYYDGSLQVISREKGTEGKIVGAKYKRQGRKIDIRTISISDLVLDYPEMPIDYSELDEQRTVQLKKAHEDLRTWYRNMENKLELENFIKWAKKQALKITEDIENIEAMATRFVEKEGIKKDVPIGDMKGKSYVEMRHAQWDEKYEVYLNEGFLYIKRKDEK